ncbi:TetR/AcrR family transcriptional regulator [Hamadaea tsunoensis]|uniref:TetR/AcrR family transcriptional regulator n=1 Tax=Hamadaea tsunoensis TaxID=53368 RepID=UPI00042966B2|nr:TetR/AcrR family transcriptional regulator [Hamadaea tsunoensis]
MTRRDDLLDAAVRVLGTRGLRQLTHRAVDAEAGLPAGSASNVFRTREALLDGVLDRLVEVETAGWQRLAGTARPLGVREFAALLGTMVEQLTRGEGRVLTLARFAVFGEAAHHPALQHKIVEARERLGAWGVPWLAALGSADPARDYRMVLDLLDGLLHNELAGPAADFRPAETIGTLLAGMLPRA